jgi:hypothetical protein
MMGRGRGKIYGQTSQIFKGFFPDIQNFKRQIALNDKKFLLEKKKTWLIFLFFIKFK